MPKPARAAEPAPVVAVGHAALIAAPATDLPLKEPASRPEYCESDAFDPIVAEGDFFCGVASQLSLMAEASEIPAKLSAPARLAAVPPAPPPAAPVDTTPTRFEPISPSDDVELSVLGELCRVAFDPPGPDASDRGAAREAGELEQADGDAFVCGALGSDKVHPREEAVTLGDLPRDVFGPLPASMLADLPQPVLESSRVTAPRVAIAPSRVVALADLPLDVFAAPEPSPEVSGAVTRSSSSGSIGDRGLAEPRLGHAVELTREALYAWMNVLTGPALVDMTSR